MTSPSQPPPAQADAPTDSDSEDNEFDMSDADLQRLTEERDKASGEDRARLEEEARIAAAQLAHKKDKKERQKRDRHAKLEDAVAPKPFDGALYSATGRRVESDQKTEFEGWRVLDGTKDEGKKGKGVKK